MSAKLLKPYMQPNAVYFADNGEIVCIHCAGSSALYTGRDRSGQRVKKVTQADIDELREMFTSGPYAMPELAETAGHCSCGRCGR